MLGFKVFLQSRDVEGIYHVQRLCKDYAVMAAGRGLSLITVSCTRQPQGIRHMSTKWAFFAEVDKCYTGAMCIMPSIEQRLLPKPITMIIDAQVPLCYESLVRPKSY